METITTEHALFFSVRSRDHQPWEAKVAVEYLSHFWGIAIHY